MPSIKESGVHKLVVADRDGNCLAFVLAWDSFDYDAETDTLCVRCQQRWQKSDQGSGVVDLRRRDLR